MRVTARWADEAGKRGRVPGRFGTVYDAEEAARDFMTKYPSVVTISISHETGGWVKDLNRD
jgi:hypothetical protein